MYKPITIKKEGEEAAEGEPAVQEIDDEPFKERADQVFEEDCDPEGDDLQLTELQEQRSNILGRTLFLFSIQFSLTILVGIEILKNPE